ncbi:hypothetical protein [Kitasatospora griseola]|uniref:hypothetical protein n=1 Tax=Kitasatospora griseola TaxID=2064 RepID=UPI00342EFDDF
MRLFRTAAAAVMAAAAEGATPAADCTAAQEACLQHKQPAAPYRCHGNQYAVKLDAEGAVLSVAQPYKP